MIKTRMARLRSRLTYANVTATLALFIALGGTSYAAITLPRNSVGAKQIRPEAIGSSEIRSRAIQLKDISRRARTSLRGQQGPVGPAGPSGVTEHAQITSSGRQLFGTAVDGGWSSNEPEVHRLVFGRDVSQCAYSATLADVPGGNVATAVPGRITVASTGGPGIIVKTYRHGRKPCRAAVSCDRRLLVAYANTDQQHRPDSPIAASSQSSSAPAAHVTWALI